MKVTNENRALILAALYNNARTLGMARLAYRPSHIMSEKEATELLKNTKYFDYLYGRVMKIDLTGPELNFLLYDRDNGLGAGYNACKGLEP